jgi:hypothetical protein
MSSIGKSPLEDVDRLLESWRDIDRDRLLPITTFHVINPYAIYSLAGITDLLLPKYRVSIRGLEKIQTLPTSSEIIGFTDFARLLRETYSPVRTPENRFEALYRLWKPGDGSRHGRPKNVLALSTHVREAVDFPNYLLAKKSLTLNEIVKTFQPIGDEVHEYLFEWV